MGGGHFDYQNHVLFEITESIDVAIINNNVKNDSDFCTEYSNDTLEKFRFVSKQLHLLNDLVHHVDYLLSGDLGEDSFNERWKKSIQSSLT